MKEAKEFRVARLDKGSEKSVAESRQLINEEPLSIQVENGPEWTLNRTPGQDVDLATGFLLSEGIALGLGEIISISESSGRLRVSLAHVREPRKDLLPVVSGAVFPQSIFYAIADEVLGRQALFKKTGASHGAALFGADGGIRALAEDLSRHCAFDKAIGQAVRGGADCKTMGAFLTCRVSAGMVAKAARMGIPLIAAISAASAAAAETAEKTNITLAGFVRGDGITIYSHPERIRAVG